MIRLIVVAMLLASTVARAQDGPATNRPKLWVGWNLTRAECDRLHGEFVDGYCYGGDLDALLSLAPDNSLATSPLDTYMRIDPAIRSQLDRIEQKLRAICANQRYIDGTADCSKKAGP